MHDGDLGGGDPDPLDVESRQGLGDADDVRSAPGGEPLDVPEVPEPERVVVVLRRDDRRAPGKGGAVDVGMHEVGMHDVGPGSPDRGTEAVGECWIEVARRP